MITEKAKFYDIYFGLVRVGAKVSRILAGEREGVSCVRMTEEAQQSECVAQNNSCSVQNDTQTNSSDVGKAKDNKKEKCRPITKVRLGLIPMTDNFSRR